MAQQNLNPLGPLVGAVNRFVQQRKEREANEAFTGILTEGLTGTQIPDGVGVIPGGASPSQVKNIQILGKLDPALAKLAFDTIRSGRQENIKRAQAMVAKRGKIAIALKDEKNPTRRATIARQLAEADPSIATQMLDFLKKNPDEQEVFLDTSILEARTFDDVLKGSLPTDQVLKKEETLFRDGEEIARGVRPGFTLKPGERRFGADAEQIAAVPPVKEEDKALSTIAKLNQDFSAGRITEQQRDLGVAKATRDPALVKVQTFEPVEAKLGAQSDAAVRDEVRSNARVASRQLGKVRSLQKVLKRAGSGSLKQFIPQLARVIPGFGELFDVEDRQAASAQINSFILDQMQAFKGSTSERELDFATQTVQQLGNTPESNAMIARNFENAIFLALQENKQFDDLVKEGGKPRDFVFNFQKVILPNHPTFGDITLDDIQTTAFENGISMEEAIKELRKR